VLEIGEVGTGDALTLVDRPHPGWTIQRANTLMYADDAPKDEIVSLSGLPTLSAEWKRMFGRKLAKTKD
jgi:MOSC domain-containing protein YiiM